MELFFSPSLVWILPLLSLGGTVYFTSNADVGLSRLVQHSGFIVVWSLEAGISTELVVELLKARVVETLLKHIRF